MKIITGQGEQDLRALARRLFVISDTPGGQTEGQALTALLRTNPHLEPDQPVPEGMPILVADTPGIDVQPIPAAPLEASVTVAAQLPSALLCVAAALKAALANEVKEDKDMLVQLQKAGPKLSHAGPDIGEHVKKIKAAAKARSKEFAQLDKYQKAGLVELKKGLDQLLKVVQK